MLRYFFAPPLRKPFLNHCANHFSLYTKDGKIVCIHDVDTGRTFDHNLTIAQSTFAELSTLKNLSGGGVPLLQDVLSITPAGKRVFIEIKTGTGILLPLQKIIEAGIAACQLTVICFDAQVLAECKRLMPHVKTCLLTGFEVDALSGKLHPDAEELIDRAAAINADGVDIHCNRLIKKDFVNKLHDAGYEVHVWTIDDRETADWFIQNGVDSITSNRGSFLAGR
ncbi:MAG: glycerophosphodiester phosphodiesterase family protein [Victivallaceae bacterium]